jgi:hypothetical protein
MLFEVLETEHKTSKDKLSSYPKEIIILIMKGMYAV